MILVYGDSITYGAWDVEAGGWVSRLRMILDRLPDPPLIYNLGVSGESTDELVERFEHESAFRIDADEDPPSRPIILFQTGANDAQYLLNSGTVRTPLNKFKTNITTLIDRAITLTLPSKVAFLSLLRVDDARVNPLPWATHLSHRNIFTDQYNDALKEACKLKTVGWIDVRAAFKTYEASHGESLLADGLHPNTEGHQLIFATVLDFLESNKLVEKT